MQTMKKSDEHYFLIINDDRFITNSTMHRGMRYIIEHLSRHSHLFIVALDGNATRYHYHRPSAQVLHHHLHQFTSQKEMNPVPKKASAWYIQKRHRHEVEHKKAEPLSSHRRENLITPLSTREQEVLQLLAQGAPNQEIAQALTITLNTVKRHVQAILTKLDVRNRTQAVARSQQLELLPRNGTFH